MNNLQRLLRRMKLMRMLDTMVLDPCEVMKVGNLGSIHSNYLAFDLFSQVLVRT